jgi:YD repeat-containing protein
VNAFQTAHNSAKTAADVKLKPILQLQDEYINVPLEVNQWRNSKLLQSKFTNYDYAVTPSTFVYPSKEQAINLTAPSTSFSAAVVSGSTISKDSKYEDESFYTFNAGNPVQGLGRDGVAKSYIWDYNNTLPIAQAINANSNEIFFSSFEEGGWNTNMQYDNTFAHCGDKAGKIVKTTAGELTSLSTSWLNVSLTAPTKYHYSGWVYSNGPSGQFYLYMKRSGETGAFTYVDNIQTTVTNKWVYLEKDFSVPADVVQLNIRCDNNGGGTVWFDDVRLYPSDAQMTTYTYDPLKGVTSQTDINNRGTFYEYDALGRLSVVRDQDNNVIKKVCYNYAGQASNCSVAGQPVYITLTNLSGISGFVATYTNVANNAQTTFNIPTTGSATVSLLPGTYKLLVNRTAGNTNYIYTACSISANAGTTTNNINVNEISCNALTVDSIF